LTEPEQALDNLARIGNLKSEPFSQSEFDGLIRSGDERLADARNEQLALSSRFDLAYNAAHAFSLAALRRCGYRSDNRYLGERGQTRSAGLSPDIRSASHLVSGGFWPRRMICVILPSMKVILRQMRNWCVVLSMPLSK